MPYRFLPDVALADVAFEAKSGSLNGVFQESAKALTAVMVDPRSVSPRVKRRINLSSEDLERLLYDFLTELIVLKDTDSLLFSSYEVEVDSGARALRCTAAGEPIDREKHRLRNDAKAVTMHMFSLKHSGKLWRATIVLDI
ncbi:MAG TPA: archease [Nitrososphaerales archaeon]|nr:archease [Nitrososphaerales archaeon]